MTGNVIRGPWTAPPRRRGSWPPPAVYLEARRRFGLSVSCGDDTDVYDSPFRRAHRLGSRHQCQLRELARQQTQDAGTATVTAISSPAAAAALAAIPVTAWPCPGEYGPGGAWQPHCPASSEGNGK